MSLTALTLLLLFGLSPLAAETEPSSAENTDVDLAELSEEEREYVLWAASFVDSLERQYGKIELEGGVATLDLPEDFYYLSPADSKRVLEEAWGNPPDELNLGMLFPKDYNPMDPEAWGVTINFVEDGFVSDDDASEINFDELLADMQKATTAENQHRAEAGFDELELIGWAQRPYYDDASKKIHWAKEIRFGQTEDHTLNYNIRVLGRRGYLELNFIAAMAQLAEIDAKKDAVLAMTNFEPGHRYADFDPEKDRMASYGLGALVAGGLLAKSGALAKFLLVFKKFWILLALGISAIAKKIFGRRDPPTQESDITPT